MYENADQRINKSRRALSEWKWLSGISDRPVDLLEMLNQEVRALADVAFEHPGKAPAIVELINGYKSLASRVEDSAESHSGEVSGSIFKH